nr:MAG TPA: hypothetical protein [Caudoviricetes sp.]
MNCRFRTRPWLMRGWKQELQRDWKTVRSRKNLRSGRKPEWQRPDLDRSGYLQPETRKTSPAEFRILRSAMHEL